MTGRQVLGNVARDKGARALERTARGAGKVGAGVGRAAQLGGLAEQQGALNLLGALGGAYAMSRLPQASTGFGAQSQMGVAGAAPSQQSQVSGNADPYGLREIYAPKEGSAFEAQKEFAGLGV